MPSDLRIETVEDEATIAEAWGTLAVSCRRIFSTPEWMGVWWRHLADGEKRRTLVAIGSNGEAAAVLPLAVGRIGPAKVVRFAGHGVADSLGPVGAPEFEGAALAAFAHSGAYRSSPW